jgi:hypothetical protein
MNRLRVRAAMRYGSATQASLYDLGVWTLTALPVRALRLPTPSDRARPNPSALTGDGRRSPWPAVRTPWASTDMESHGVLV